MSTATAASPNTQSSPLRAVLDAFETGSTSVAEVANKTGLPIDLVRAILDQLIRMGKMRATEMSYGCPTGDSDCGSCAEASESGASCSPEPGSTRGPVLIEINTQAMFRPERADLP